MEVFVSCPAATKKGVRVERVRDTDEHTSWEKVCPMLTGVERCGTRPCTFDITDLETEHCASDCSSGSFFHWYDDTRLLCQPFVRPRRACDPFYSERHLDLPTRPARYNPTSPVLKGKVLHGAEDRKTPPPSMKSRLGKTLPRNEPGSSGTGVHQAPPVGRNFLRHLSPSCRLSPRSI